MHVRRTRTDLQLSDKLFDGVFLSFNFGKHCIVVIILHEPRQTKRLRMLAREPAETHPLHQSIDMYHCMCVHRSLLLARRLCAPRQLPGDVFGKFRNKNASNDERTSCDSYPSHDLIQHVIGEECPDHGFR